MTRAEAEARCAELNGDAAGWLVREIAPGDWRAVQVKVPGLERIRPLKATTEAKPKPPQAPDPRPGIFRDIPPYGPA